MRKDCYVSRCLPKWPRVARKERKGNVFQLILNSLTIQFLLGLTVGRQLGLPTLGPILEVQAKKLSDHLNCVNTVIIHPTAWNTEFVEWSVMQWKW